MVRHTIVYSFCAYGTSAVIWEKIAFPFLRMLIDALFPLSHLDMLIVYSFCAYGTSAVIWEKIACPFLRMLIDALFPLSHLDMLSFPKERQMSHYSVQFLCLWYNVTL
ncbi:MAG: hypothetical protein FD143_3355 [Ignavibacteria bacterium]|nr:MAG: hypothetical protein FD143_3355 [Ignavibacteria bacterium]